MRICCPTKVTLERPLVLQPICDLAGYSPGCALYVVSTIARVTENFSLSLLRKEPPKHHEDLVADLA